MIFELIVFIICILFSVIFSSVETAFTSISHIKVSQLVENKVFGSKIIKKLKDEPSKLLSTVLIGNNIVNISASVFATSVILAYFNALGDPNPQAILGVATIAITLIIIVFGEIIPKNVAIRNAEKIAVIFSVPIFVVSVILTPVAFVLTLISKPFVMLFGGKISDKGPFLTEEDLKFLIATSSKEGIIEKKEQEMISSIFDFSDTSVKEVMTPRPDIKAVEISATIDDLLISIKETGHSRIPVYDGNLDNIVGVVYAKDLLSCLRSDSIRNYMRPVIFIPEGKKVDELLHQMQANRTHIAIVVDEYGVTSGIVSMEDIIEEIVGEIHDEFERHGEKPLEQIAANSYTIDGKMLIEDINRELDLNLPLNEDYDTIGGFVVSMLGKMPSVGDAIKYENIDIKIERVLKRRITRVKLFKWPVMIDDNVVGG